MDDVDALGGRFVGSLPRMWPPDTLQTLLDDGRAADLPPLLRGARILQAAMAATAGVPATCVLHGDTHSGNAYFDRDGRVCWLDWQVAQRGHWSMDVSYHLGTVLDPDTRRAHERELLDHSLTALAGHGVTPPPWDEAWERYTLGFSSTCPGSERHSWTTRRSRGWASPSPGRAGARLVG